MPAIAEYRNRDGSRVANIDGTTALWAGRMLMGEGWKGGKGAAVLWAMMYRYMGMPHQWKSYLDLIRSFSQPINPKWVPGGLLYEKYKNSKREVYKIATSKRAVARRQRIHSLTWEDMPEKVKEIVYSFALGELPQPVKFNGKMYSNFASYSGVDKKYPGGIWWGKEYFFVDPGLRKKTIVQVVPNVGNAPHAVTGDYYNDNTSDLAMAAILVAAAALAYRYLKK